METTLIRNNLPQELKHDGRFCLWRYEERNGKQTKVPYSLTGGMTRSNDPSTFSYFCNVEMAMSTRSGVNGIGLGIFDGVCAIDLDDCFEEDGITYKPIAGDIVRIMRSYTEKSPSGKGVHILFRADGFTYDKERYYIMNHRDGIEVYVAGATNKYVTVTGDKCEDHMFGERSAELTRVLEKYMQRNTDPPETDVRTDPQIRAINAVNAIKGRMDDDVLLNLAGNASNGAGFRMLFEGDTTGYGSHSEADMALCQHLAFWTGKDPDQMDRLFRRSGLMRDKWDRKQSGSTYGAITVNKAIGMCTETYTPHVADTESVPGKTVITTVPFRENADEGESPEPEFADYQPLHAAGNRLPEFPVACLPREIAEYVRAVSESSQTAPEMAATIALGVMAICLQGKYVIEGHADYTEPLSLYTVVIAPPAERKSSVVRKMTEPILKYQERMNESMKTQIRESRLQRESLERKVNRLKTALEHTPDILKEKELAEEEARLDSMEEIKPIRLYGNDCSAEALTSLLADHGGVFSVISSEGGIFDIMAGMYNKQTNIDVWLKAHCGDMIVVDRKGRSTESIPHPALSAVLAIQPCVLGDIMDNKTFAGRGLIARFLYAFPASRVGSRTFTSPPMDWTVNAQYDVLIQDLLSIPMPEEPTVLKLSDEATELLSEYFMEHERYLAGEGQMMPDWAGKYIGTVLRIAGLVHATEAKEAQLTVDADTVRRAIEIGKFFLAHAAYAYDLMGTDDNIRKAAFVMNKVRQSGQTRMKRSEVFQMCRGKYFHKTEDILPTLDLLESRGHIRMETTEKTRGRPQDVQVIINPRALAA